jgi:glycosyltransferase involved in cell wall biosynthesis
MNKIKNILYLGWLGKENVGDEVLYELFKLMFYKYHKSEVKDTAVNIDTLSTVQSYIVDVSAYDLIVLGGGSLLQYPYFLKICQDGVNKGIPVVSWGTGVDGAYNKEHLNTIHISGENTKDILSLYEQFEYISVRGPFSKNILKNSGLKKQVYEVGDPALAYSKEMFGDELEYKGSSRKILVNWGTSYNNIFGGNELAVENELVTVIKELLSQDYSVIVYPIWTEDIEPVKRLVQKVNDNRCEIISEVYEAKILQKFISQAYMTINLKLHANILSAAANRPFISLAYRGKCFEFANTVDCSEYALATNETTSNRILDMLKSIEINYENIVNRLMTAKERYYPVLINSIKHFSNIINNEHSKPKTIANVGVIYDSFQQCSGLKQEAASLLTHIIQQINLMQISTINSYFLEEIFKSFVSKHSKYLQHFNILLQISVNYLRNKVSSQVFKDYLKNQFQLEQDTIEIYVTNLSLLKESSLKNDEKLNITGNIPKVSIVITTYNRKGFLEQGIQSYLNQDYPNMEIIIIDDCSTDGTEELMQNKFADEKSIKYVRLNENKGPGKNTKYAIQNHADGEFIMIPDDDDYLIDHNYLTKAVNFHLGNPSISFVAADVFYHYTKSNLLAPNHLNLSNLINRREYFLNFLQKDYPKPAALVTAVFKRSALIDMGLLEMEIAIDASIYLRSLLVGDAGYIDSIAGVYRIHGNNLTFNLSTKFIIETLEEKLAIKKKAIESYGYGQEEMDEWWENNVFSSFTFYLANSPESARDTIMYLWVKENCPNIIKKIDRKFLNSYWFNQQSFQKVMRFSIDLSVTILEAIDHVLLTENQNFEQNAYLLKDIVYGINTIQNSIDDFKQHIDVQDIESIVNSTLSLLDTLISEYQTGEYAKVRKTLKSNIEPACKDLKVELETTFKPFFL